MSADRAREIYRQLQNLARADYHGTTGPLLVVYGVEGFLRRLAASEYAAKMTLKGGMAYTRLEALTGWASSGVSPLRSRCKSVRSPVPKPS